MPATPIATTVIQFLKDSVGTDFVQHYGKKKYYSKAMIDAANRRHAVVPEWYCWTYRLFTSPTEFSDIRNRLGEDWDYAAMASQLASAAADGAFMADEKKKGWSLRIESRDGALRTVKESAMTFFIVAAIQIVFSFWWGFSLIIDAVLYGAFAFWLLRGNSRIAALLLLFLTLMTACVTLANMMGADFPGGRNILFALVLLWIAIRSVKATFKLHWEFA